MFSVTGADFCIGGLTAQGLGMLVAFLMYAQYIRRLLEFGLPSPNMRPGMFISVGENFNNEGQVL